MNGGNSELARQIFEYSGQAKPHENIQGDDKRGPWGHWLSARNIRWSAKWHVGMGPFLWRPDFADFGLL